MTTINYMYNHLLYLGYWLTNSIVLLLSTLVTGNSVILGGDRFNTLEASIYAGFWLTFLIWVWWDFAIARKFKLDKGVIIFGFFLFVNIFSLVAVSRFHFFTGFELINYFWVLAIALLATILQRVAWKLIVNRG